MSDPGGRDPLISKRGLIISKRLSGASIDYLTLTIPDQSSDILTTATDYDRPGYGNEGFRASEYRTFHGGVCFRRMEPVSESKQHGLGYESWRFPGPNAAPAAIIAKQIEGAKPSYIDFAFDFTCTEEDLSDHVIDACRQHVEQSGFSIGISGKDNTNTRYVASKTSDRRIKVYRKDLDDKAYAALHGPTLRVEVTLKAEHAANIWHIYVEQGQDKAFACAAAHIKHMTGLEVADTIGTIPELVHVDQSSAAALLAQNIKQNASWIHAALRAGVNLPELIALVVEQQSPVARSRMNRRKRDIQAAGAEHVQHLAALIITEAKQTKQTTRGAA